MSKSMAISCEHEGRASEAARAPSLLVLELEIMSLGILILLIQPDLFVYLRKFVYIVVILAMGEMVFWLLVE